MAFVKAGDITVHYRLSGPEGAPVVMFSNSIGTSFQIWDAVAEALSQRFRVLCYDTRGHGLSDVTQGPYSMALLARDCVHLLDALGIDSAHFCGLSIGGMIAQQLAAEHGGRVDRLVLCDTGMRIGTPEMWRERARNTRGPGLESMAEAVLQRWFTADFFRREPASLAGYRNMLVRTPAEGYAGACEAIRDADLQASTRTIAAKTLVVCGSEDIATPPAMSREIAEAVPDARVEEIVGAAHLPCVEQPRLLAKVIAGFLEEARA